LAITRRQLLQGGAFAAATPAFLTIAGLAEAPFAHAQSNPELSWRHALSLFGDIKYPDGFRRFDYVNPDAPKAGLVRQNAAGTFDNFNVVIGGLKGSLAGGVGLPSAAPKAVALVVLYAELPDALALAMWLINSPRFSTW